MCVFGCIDAHCGNTSEVKCFHGCSDPNDPNDIFSCKPIKCKKCGKLMKWINW